MYCRNSTTNPQEKQSPPAKFRFIGLLFRRVVGAAIDKSLYACHRQAWISKYPLRSATRPPNHCLAMIGISEGNNRFIALWRCGFVLQNRAGEQCSPLQLLSEAVRQIGICGMQAKQKTAPTGWSALLRFAFISPRCASERSTRCSTQDGRTWAGRAPWPRRRSGRR